MKHLSIIGLLGILLLLCVDQLGPVQNDQLPIIQGNPIRDGSVLFWQGGLLVKPILKHTDSTITHAAVILYVNDEPWVYEAVPPRVHKMPLADYCRMLEVKSRRHAIQNRGFTWFIIQPRTPYTAEQLEAMKCYAESQLGRPYMLRGWWKGHEVRGIFCSQYVGDVIEQSGKISSAHIRESPASLYQKLIAFYQ